jgi:hypothetical protein
MNPMQSKRLSARMVAVLLWAAWPLIACPVPVFRYALERWEPAPYQAFVLHRGALDADVSAAVKWLSGAAGRQPLYANVLVTVADLSQPGNAPVFGKLWEAQGKPDVPWLVVKRPPPGAYGGTTDEGLPDEEELLSSDDIVYAGPVTMDAVKSLLDSPVRREIARRILNGDSAVWVLLECGDRQKDDAATKLLADTLTRLQDDLKLPDASDEPLEGYMSPGGPELKISFSAMRVSRKAPAESVLVNTVLGASEAAAKTPGPVLLPVFGRGRVLAAIAGEDLTEQTIASAAEFLVADCSCQAGGMRPGLDLLMSAGWDNFIVGKYAVDESLPPLVGLPASGAAQAAGEFGGFLLRHVVVIVVAAAAVIAIATGVMMRRGRANRR